MTTQLQKSIIPLRRDLGFTLLELLLVLFIFSLSLALVIPSITTGFTNLKIKTATKRFATTLRYARNLAIGMKIPYYVQVFPDENKLIITSAKGKEAAKKEVALSDEIRVTINEGDVVAFYPRGNSTGGSFDIYSKEVVPFYIIRVEPSTGRIRVEML